MRGKRGRVGGLAGALLLAMLMAATAQATRVRVMNLAELVEHAQRIFVGRCVAEEAAAAGSIPYTRYTFEVLDAVKGVGGERVTVGQFGVTRPRAMPGGKMQVTRISGMPRYRPGDKVLLFLGPESAIGLSSPVGLQQGAFLVLGEGRRQKLVNAVDNRNLSHGLDLHWMIERGVGAEAAAAMSRFPGGAMDYEHFLQLLKTLVRQP